MYGPKPIIYQTWSILNLTYMQLDMKKLIKNGEYVPVYVQFEWLGSLSDMKPIL